jgi:(1->4)-alpha-D-glucan 1-alpha-D-glucosylmutase
MTAAIDPGMAAAPRLPVSTYRLQLRAGCTFEDAARLAPYLHRLGITDLYSSPIFQFHPGSTHGYDVTDHRHVSDDLGGELGLGVLSAALDAHGMGLVLDFVPNHMGIEDARANHWWWDVIENGPCSPYARFFDIDWTPVKAELTDKVLLPVLGDQYGRALERGELVLDLVDGALVLRYFEHVFPINPRRAPSIFRRDIAALVAALGEQDPDVRELLSILTALDNLPAIVETAPERVNERQREKEIARERLARLIANSGPIRAHLAACLADVTGTPGDADSFDALHALLEVQAYRLAAWRTAFHEINYRRFFDVNTLISIRMEEPEVFAAAHELLVRLVGEGIVTGLRLDHLDGLSDPAEYLRNLEHAVRSGRGLGVPRDGDPPPLWVVAEKILSAGETLPKTWRLHGSSGYDFLNELNGVFVDPHGERSLRRTYERFTGIRAELGDIVYTSKKIVMESTLASELNVLAHQLNRISESDRCSRDFTLNSLRDMLLEVVACFPAYRSYVTAADHHDADVRLIDTAIERAQRRNPAMDASIFTFLRDVMLEGPAAADAATAPDRLARREFVLKLQQYTGPVQAKGLEDTAFYRYNLLLSANEVGGAPQRFSRSVESFHEGNRMRAIHWPHAMLCTATHDTKRGEDARARLNVLSEIPDAWSRALTRWSQINASHRTIVEGAPAPDRNDEIHFYQALLAIWPPGATAPGALAARLGPYMAKVVREAKVHTSWIHEQQGYEQAVADFVARTLEGPRASRFLDHFLPLAERVARLGMLNSLAQLVLKLASPGVPDFYQGSELWDLSVVDPDNRRPVDFRERDHLLQGLEPLLDGSGQPEARADGVRQLLREWSSGAIKLYLTACGLRLRRELTAVFLHGTYRPIEVSGEKAEHVVALVRRHGDDAVLAVVPRWCARLTFDEAPLGLTVWGTTELALPPDLAGRSWVDAFSGWRIDGDPPDRLRIPVGRVLSAAPVALLRSIDGAPY